MEYRTTKIRKYGKGLYQSDNKSTYYKVHFIHMFDGDDLWEHSNGKEENEPTEEEFSDSDIKMCNF